MSSNDNGNYSPLFRRTIATIDDFTKANRWTVDNTENRFHSFTAQSPKRSILKGNTEGGTPLRYNAPSFIEQRNRELEHKRRVSFAREAKLRMYNEDESPDVTSRGVPNLIEEPMPSALGHDALNSPLFIISDRFTPLSRLSASPADLRKRRSDLFGTPPGEPRSHRRRLGGRPPSLISRVVDEESPQVDQEFDLMQYMKIPQAKVNKGNLFDDNDDEEEEEEEDDDERLVIPPTSSSLSSSTSPPPRQQFNRREEEEEGDVMITGAMSPVYQQQDQYLTESSQNDLTMASDDMMITQTYEQEIRQTQHEPPSPSHSHQQQEDDMILTEIITRNTNIVTSRQEGDDDDMIITETIPSNRIAPTTSQQSNDDDSMLITQPITKSANPFTTANAQDDETILPLLEQESEQLSHELLPFNHHTLPSSPLRVLRPLHQPSPSRPLISSVQRSPYHFPSPAARFLTPLQSSSATYSPHRQFYLHETGQARPSGVVDQEEEEEQEEEEYRFFTDDVEPEQNMPLVEFLGLVGITFPEDMPARRRSTHSTTNYGVATTAQQAYAAAALLPEIELYTKAIEKTHQIINASREAISRIDQSVSQANPQIFTEFLEGQISLRNTIEKQLQAIRSYAHIKSERFTYEWLTPQLDALVEKLKGHGEALKQDIGLLDKAEQKLKEKIPTAKVYHGQLKRRLMEEREKLRQYNSEDHEQLAYYEKEIERQRNVLNSFKAKQERLEQDEGDLLEREASLVERIKQLKLTIQKADAKVSENQFITAHQLMEAKDKYEQCSQVGHWQLEKADDTIVQLQIEKDIDVLINKTKLAQHESDAVLLRMFSGRDQALGAVAELFPGLQMVARDKWDMNEIMQDVHIYWNRVLMVQRELRDLRRRFWVETKTLDQESIDGGGFSCEICMFSMAGNLKFTLTFQVRPKDIMNYPKIDLSTLDLKLHYGGKTIEQLRLIVEKELKEEGMMGLHETLRKMLDQVVAPTPTPTPT